MNSSTHVLSEEVFGSSKKIQFVQTTSSMDSLLSAVDRAPRINLPYTQSKQTMSIEALLDTNGHISKSSAKRSWTYDITDRSPKTKIHRSQLETHSPPTEHCPEPIQHLSLSSSLLLPPQRLSTITCLHAAVAQKSYGSEKRFLCPPPVVTLKSTTPGLRTDSPIVSMSVVCESIDRPVEQRASLDDNQSGSFKYLHVTGTAKAKQFCLRVGLSHSHIHSHSQFPPLGSSSPQQQQNQHHQISQPFATFFSSPVSIISKPSKKTAKARNVSTCILANSPVSLFNRINSQTVRTKYMSSDANRLCAKSSAWSAFNIQIIRQPEDAEDNEDGPVPVLYGTEIILKDTQSGVCSPPLIVRKVDKGCIAATATGPISQMQKIALQLKSSVNSQPTYLSAGGNIITPTDQSSDHNGNTSSASITTTSLSLSSSSAAAAAVGSPSSNQNSNAWLDISPSQPSKNNNDPKVEVVDDYLCWTIVSIAKFEYTFADPIMVGMDVSPCSKMAESRLVPSSASSSSYSSPSHSPSPSSLTCRHAQPSPPPSPPRTIVPYPSLSSVSYNHTLHAIDVVGHHLFQKSTMPPRLLEFWLGNHGPLKQVPHETSLVRVELPPTQDLLVANHNILQRQANGERHLELALVLVRQDGMVYPTGKSLSCAVSVNGDTSRCLYLHFAYIILAHKAHMNVRTNRDKGAYLNMIDKPHG
ncbi:p53-like transcription factor [Phycomyces blakesleeanus]